MKNLILIIVFCIIYQFGTAQDHIPLVKNNMEFNYVCKMHGQTRSIRLTTKMVSDTLVLDCELRKAKGSYTILPEALKSGTELSFRRIEPSEVLTLKPTETFFIISQDAYQDLLKNDRFIYNNTTYILDGNSKKNDIVIEGKLVDTLHVIAQVDETEMWILKNPEFPFIVKIDKNPLGINCTLTEIVYK